MLSHGDGGHAALEGVSAGGEAGAPRTRLDAADQGRPGKMAVIAIRLALLCNAVVLRQGGKKSVAVKLPRDGVRGWWEKMISIL